MTSTKDLMCDNLLPIKASADEWKTAQPLTNITKLVYPFDIARPTKEEVCTLHYSETGCCITLCVYVYVVGSCV